MEIIVNPPRERWDDLCRRNIPADDAQVTAAVEEIAGRIAREGDAALTDYCRRFDGLDPQRIAMTPEEIDTAAEKVAPEVKKAIVAAASNISVFHRSQLMEPIEVATALGVRCIQRQVPIERVGLYIPGGRAPLFSTVLMLGIPAKIAGCKEVILCTPGASDREIASEIAYAAKVCGITRIFRVGGAQAIAAMAYGTATIPAVDKIFGPGNRYVTKAKQLVSTHTAIDMPAGPSEVMVMADETAVASFVASDLLSQAEHGPDSQAILVAKSETIATQVAEEVERQKALLRRAESVEKSLSASRLIVLPDKDDMIAFANRYASEHLIIAMNDPWSVADKITAAGSIFLGNYSPESAGDYASGTNHTLPTSGWARSMSGVNIDSFMKKITYQQLTSSGLRNIAKTIVTMADAEGLDAHANAVKIRLNACES